MDKERRIEKLLRAFAKKRKADAGAPLEMHPATRRLLQGEVARRAKTRPPTEQAWWRFWFGTRGRAFATCAFVSILISGTVFVTTMKPKQPAMNLAKNDKDTMTARQNAEPMKERELQPTAAPPAPEMPTLALGTPAAAPLEERKIADTDLARDGGAGGGGASGFGGAVATTSPAVSSTSAGMAMFDDKSSTDATVTYALNTPVGEAADKSKADVANVLQKDAPVFAESLQPDRTPPGSALTAAPAPNTESHLFAGAQTRQSNIETLNFAGLGNRDENMDTLAAKSEMPAQRFYRLRADTGPTEDATLKAPTLGAVKKQTANDVLNYFSVVQNGNKLTVVDSDGSQYSGTLQMISVGGELADVPVQSAPAAPTRRARGGMTSAATTMNVMPIEMGNYAFTVSGTNVSLKQLVVFSGNFVPATNNIAVNGTVTNSLTSDVFGPQSGAQNLRIEGQATVGSKQKKTEVKIEAAQEGQ